VSCTISGCSNRKSDNRFAIILIMGVRRFRLLQVAGEGLPLSGSIMFPADQSVDREPSFSIFIGVNGVGKSRLLSRLAEAFVFLGRQSEGPRAVGSRKRFPLELLRYQIDDEVVDVGMVNGEVYAQVNERVVDIRSVALPSRVIALTATAFDKFPSPRTLTDFPEIYTYLGLRDVMGRSSIKALLYRSIEELIGFLESRMTDEVFDVLSYDPILRVQYRFARHSPLVNAAKQGDSALESFLFNVDRPSMRLRTDTSRVKRAVERGDITIRGIVEALDRATSTQLPYVKMTVTFGKNHTRIRKSSAAVNEDLKLLRRIGVLTLDSVELFRGGEAVELMQASSGEVSLAAQFIGMASAVEHGALILIDEPEVSLHPEWQRKYLDLINACFGSFSGSHFIIATHSPLVIGDMPQENSRVISLDGETANLDGGYLSGESADFVLVNAFNVASPKNYYLRELVAQALAFAADNKLHTEEFGQLMNRLLELQLIMPESPMRTLIEDLAQARLRYAK
jgi:predicted ATPase